MNKIFAALLGGLCLAAPASAKVTHNITWDAQHKHCTSHWTGDDQDNALGSLDDPCANAIYYGGLGADTIQSGPRVAHATYVFRTREESWGTPSKYIINWHNGDVIEVSDVCTVEFQFSCSFNSVAGAKSQRTHNGRFYYQYWDRPLNQGWLTFVLGDFGTKNLFDFLVLINGRPVLTDNDFNFGRLQ